MYAVYFEPEEWVSFREARRFGAGDVARTTLPTALPFYGAVRTALMAKKGVHLDYHKQPSLSEDLKELLGDENHPGKIKLYGPFVFTQCNGVKKHFFPAPKNVYLKEGTYKLMPCSSFKTKVGDFELDLAWIPDVKNVDEAEEQYIELDELKKLKRGESFKLENPSNFEVESRTGIALEKASKRGQEGMLYSVSVYRFKNGGFFMLTDSEDTVNEISKLDGVFLGSKQRWARVWVEKFSFDFFEDVSSENVALLLLTPAIYSGGFVPRTGRFGSVEIRAVVGARKMVVSGWDIANGHPKTMYHAVSPGAVYYLRGKLKDPKEVMSESFLNQFGFGLFTYIPYENF
ncbi:type III-B CRISPR module-associated protein Cmr3 [Fervidobacterium thailandense]|nr:type III-B CRISPR module-associated protein Cmr3 [Fervidobacterium thailandense]